MAVEKLTSKSEARDELRGIQIVEDIPNQLLPTGNHDERYFESIYGWWMQSSPLPSFQVGELVFPDITAPLNGTSRTRKRPTSQSFVRNSVYLISFKPLYDMDLKRFIRECRTMYPVSTSSPSPFTSSGVEEGGTVRIGDIAITEVGALRLVHEMCHAVRILHDDDLNIVHRDIKPKNLMLSGGHVVVIDFGFADYGERAMSSSSPSSPWGNQRERVCVTEAGKVKGEINYVLADDVALYRGCREGDAYALGRTIYEVMFEPPQSDADSGKKSITVEAAERENGRFREQIEKEDAAERSRFPMSARVRDCILTIVRGLCQRGQPLSLLEAEVMASRMLERLGVPVTMNAN